jgi:hypothetical protein
VNAASARAVALVAHVGQLTRYGEALTRHLERVAARVPPEAAVTAWLHDLGERGNASVHELLARGITPTELAALELLTRTDGEDYGLYIKRIARAEGEAGWLARTVKLAELSDHLERLPGYSPSARPYRAAGEQLERAQAKRDRRSVRPAGPQAL